MRLQEIMEFVNQYGSCAFPLLVFPPPPRSPNEFVEELGSVAEYTCSDRKLFMLGDVAITCNALTRK